MVENPRKNAMAISWLLHTSEGLSSMPFMLINCRVFTYGIANYSIIQEGKYVATD